MNPIAIAGCVVLGLSLLGNVFLGNSYLHQRDKATKVETETVFVKAAAEECSKGTDDLAKAGQARATAAAPKREAAASAAAEHDSKADQILATAPAVPGDACKSAQALVDDWWAGRGKP